MTMIMSGYFLFIFFVSSSPFSPGNRISMKTILGEKESILLKRPLPSGPSSISIVGNPEHRLSLSIWRKMTLSSTINVLHMGSNPSPKSLFQQDRNILPEGKAFLFLLEYVPVVSTGFAIHASVIFSLKLSLQATRLVQ